MEKVRVVKINLPDYKPSERQNRFHASGAFETLYGGAAGGGKTAAICAEAITACIEDDFTHVYIFRRTLGELKQSIYPEVMGQIAKYQALPDNRKANLTDGRKLLITYNSQESVFKFSNGSFIQLAYLDSVADRYRYQSAEIHVLMIDELTHFLQDDYEFLKTRIRSKDARRLRVMCATNPGGVGMGWVKERFIKRREYKFNDGSQGQYKPEKEYTDPHTGLARVFIPAKVTDHPIALFRESYLKVLNAIPDENLKAALRDGNWDKFEGQVFTEWDKQKHILNGPLPVDLNLCEKFVSFDWGYNDWACATWLCRAPENEQGVRHIYAYREIYDRQHPPQWWAEQIEKITRDEPIEYLILPHDCYSHLGGNMTIARVFQDQGLPIIRADSLSHKAKMHRMALTHQLLQVSPDGTPYLVVHSNNANLIRTLPDLSYSDTRPEEIDDKAEDHAFDSLTYGLMVMVDGESWIYNDDKNERTSPYRRSFVVDETHGFSYDVGLAIRNQEYTGRDWRYW